LFGGEDAVGRVAGAVINALGDINDEAAEMLEGAFRLEAGTLKRIYKGKERLPGRELLNKLEVTLRVLVFGLLGTPKFKDKDEKDYWESRMRKSSLSFVPEDGDILKAYTRNIAYCELTSREYLN